MTAGKGVTWHNVEHKPVRAFGVPHIHNVLHFPEKRIWKNLNCGYELHSSTLTHTCFCCKDELVGEVVVCAVQQTWWKQWVPIPVHRNAIYVFFNLFVWHELKWDQLHYVNIRLPTVHLLRHSSTGWIHWLSLSNRLNWGGSLSPLHLTTETDSVSKILYTSNIPQAVGNVQHNLYLVTHHCHRPLETYEKN